MLRWQTAGESHGEALVAMIEGLPAGVRVTSDDVVDALARRRLGYGRGARMKFEQDKVRLLTGVRFGETLGSPVAIEIANTEWPKWTEVMSADPLDHDLPREGRNAPLSRPRPGHADLTGMRKYGFDDARPVLERSSARETASRVALGAVAARFLEQAFGIRTVSHVISIGGAGVEDADDAALPTPDDVEALDASPVRTLDKAAEERMIARIDEIKSTADTVGGVIEVLAYGVPAGFEGVVRTLMRWYHETDSDQMKQYYESYMREVPCQACNGRRLRPEVLAVTVDGESIADVCDMPVERGLAWINGLKLEGAAATIAGEVVKEIRARLGFLNDVGLNYLTLSRAAKTLSGGEAQRIRLATQIGSGLVGVMYVLDEPSIGLHQRDNARLIETLHHLRDLGNTLIVVEHDQETIERADWVVDIGPGAGEHGGEVIYSGPAKRLIEAPRSVTGDYIAGRRSIEVPAVRRKPHATKRLRVVGARENNLKNITVDFPLGVMTVVTGVSGSGKSTLVNTILYPVLADKLNGARIVPGKHTRVEGLDQCDKVIHVDQNPIGRTPRSNPATYTGVWDKIRTLFAKTPEAQVRGYGPGRFSFNVKGGRCEACHGDGTLKIEMNFLPDVYVECEECHGKRYNRETLEVKYNGKTVADVLDMPIEEAATFFKAYPSISRYLDTLVQVGLGYIRLGQPAPTLSGGESQRVKLATELQRRSTGKTVYILDEPTTGLHFEDVRKLLLVLQGLVDKGNTVIVIEHNLDVVKSADWIIDLGPEGGDGGGTIVTQGTPEQVAQCEASWTGKFLKDML